MLAAGCNRQCVRIIRIQATSIGRTDEPSNQVSEVSQLGHFIYTSFRRENSTRLTCQSHLPLSTGLAYVADAGLVVGGPSGAYSQCK